MFFLKKLSLVVQTIELKIISMLMWQVSNSQNTGCPVFRWMISRRFYVWWVRIIACDMAEAHQGWYSRVELCTAETNNNDLGNIIQRDIDS